MNNQASKAATLSPSRKYTIFFTLIVKLVVNMQEFAKRFKALNTEQRRLKNSIPGYIPDWKELLTVFSRILSDISGIDQVEMRQFIKEYMKDHLKKRIKNDASIGQERVEEIVYTLSMTLPSVEGVNVLGKAQSIVKKDSDRERKIFENPGATKLRLFSEAIELVSKEMCKLVGCDVNELNQASYVLVSEIIDEL